MESKVDKSIKLESRMADFVMDVITLTRQANKSAENRVICDQLIRSAASVGANYTEANNAVSRQDFRNKIFTSKKEAAESRYWLKLFARVNTHIDTTYLIGESTELVLILQKIVTTLKNGQ